MVEIDKHLLSEITAFCKSNELEVNKYITNLLRRAFATEKFGEITMQKDKDDVENKVEEEIEANKQMAPIEKQDVEIQELSVLKQGIEVKDSTTIKAESKSKKVRLN